MGGVVPVVEDHLRGNDGCFWPLCTQLASGIQIAVPMWKITARHLKTDAVPRLENMRRRPEVDRVLVYLAGRDGFGGTQRFAIAGTDDPARDVDGDAVGRNVAQLSGEVGIRCRGG